MQNIIILFLVLVCITLILLLFFLRNKLNQEKKQRIDIASKLKELESKTNAVHLEVLESRLNPHLFKNILNSIQSHAYQTYFALDKLAGVLDYILYESRNKYVTPKEEIEFAMNLIEINKIKLNPLFELKVKTKIDEQDPLCHQQLLAPLISIDLIENAFKHADLQSSDSFISIVFELMNGNFILTVINKLASQRPMIKEKGGIGTKTFDERLRIIYNDHYKLERYVENDVYIAHLKIDLLGYKNQMRDIG